MVICYFPAARGDIKNVLKWSAENFGQAAAHRYKRPLALAICEIAANPSLRESAARTHADTLPVERDIEFRLNNWTKERNSARERLASLFGHYLCPSS